MPGVAEHVAHDSDLGAVVNRDRGRRRVAQQVQRHRAAEMLGGQPSNARGRWPCLSIRLAFRPEPEPALVWTSRSAPGAPAARPRHRKSRWGASHVRQRRLECLMSFHLDQGQGRRDNQARRAAGSGRAEAPRSWRAAVGQAIWKRITQPSRTAAAECMWPSPARSAPCAISASPSSTSAPWSAMRGSFGRGFGDCLYARHRIKQIRKVGLGCMTRVAS